MPAGPHRTPDRLIQNLETVSQKSASHNLGETLCRR
jgi:hypothetical protein